MTRMQKRIFLALAILIALTRLLAIAHSLFDWDEALFSLGVRDYDVTQHHPHPPGYPLFIAAAKGIHLLGVSEFRSLQALVVLGAMFVFPALYWLARELGFDFTTAACGAAMYAFLPNVWLYGGTAFSDVPATTIAFVACALLLRGRRDARAYVAGAIVLGIAAGIRPSNLLIGVVPALSATASRIRSRRAERGVQIVALAIGLGALLVIGSYAGAALASDSVAGYREAVRVQSEWVRNVDSWRNPGRGPLRDAAITFFLRPFENEDVLNAIAIASAISLIGALVTRRAAPLLAVAVFAPLGVTSWLNFDINTASRYAIGYMALHALLAADGFRVVLRRRELQILFSTAAVGVFAVSTWPGLHEQRENDAPPVAALRFIAENVPPEAPVYIHASMRPHAEYLLPRHRKTYFEELHQIPQNARNAWFVDWRIHPGAQTFVRGREGTWKVLRRRNFEATAGRVGKFVKFGDGWYLSEGPGDDGGRWMRKEGVVMLPPMKGSGRLSMRFAVPVDMLPAPPRIEVLLNGTVVERFAGTEPFMNKSWVLPSRGDAPDELRLRTSATIVPAADGESLDRRELGLRLIDLSWTPVR